MSRKTSVAFFGSFDTAKDPIIGYQFVCVERVLPPRTPTVSVEPAHRYNPCDWVVRVLGRRPGPHHVWMEELHECVSGRFHAAVSRSTIATIAACASSSSRAECPVRMSGR